MQGGVLNLSLADYLHGDRSAREAFCTALTRGLQRYGFVILREHSIAPALIDEAYALSAQFFAQGEPIKRGYSAGARGYAPFQTEHARNQTNPDLKEFWQIGPESVMNGGRNVGVPSNIWPRSPPAFKQTFLALFDALQATGRTILEALTRALAVPKEFFDGLMLERNSVLRLLHYPPLVDDEAMGSVRSAAHEDINLITLLLAPQGPGLELLDRDGRWLSVETSRNDLIVDSGDMLARMTNDVIPATTHRVVNPSAQNVSRYSMPFFMHPDADVVLRCLPACVGAGPKYEDIRAGTFLEQRLTEIGLLASKDRDVGADRDAGADR